MKSTARAKFSSGAGPQRIWMSATLVVSAIVEFNHRAHRDHGGVPFDLCVLRDLRGENHFAESAGTILMLSITTRSVGLLGSPMLFFITGVSPIFSSTSLPLTSLPNVVY